MDKNTHEVTFYHAFESFEQSDPSYYIPSYPFTLISLIYSQNKFYKSIKGCAKMKLFFFFYILKI